MVEEKQMMKYSDHDTPEKRQKRTRFEKVYKNEKWMDQLQTKGRGFNVQQDLSVNLSNKIHPLLGPLAAQPGFEAALLLVSRHLEADCLLPFWYAVLFGELVPLQNESEAFQIPIHKLSLPTKPLGAKDARCTRETLRKAAKHIRFFINANAAHETYHAFADTHRVHPDDSQFGHLNSGAPGSGAIIMVRLEFAGILYPDSSISAESKLRMSFFLARTLLHELTHALFMYRIPKNFEISGRCNTLEPFVEDQIFSEIGFALETHFFGGTVEIVRDTEDLTAPYGLWVRKFPSWDSNHRVPTALPQGSVQMMRKPYHERWTTAYVLSMEFIQAQFTDHFWNVTVKERGIDALKVSKAPDSDFLGVRKMNTEWSPTKEARWSPDSSFSRYANSDFFVLPGAIFSPRSPRYLRYTIPPLGPSSSGSPATVTSHAFNLSPTSKSAHQTPNGGGRIQKGRRSRKAKPKVEFEMGKVSSPLTAKEKGTIKFFDKRGKQIIGKKDDYQAYIDELSLHMTRLACPPVHVRFVHWIDEDRTEIIRLDPRYYG